MNSIHEQNYNTFYSVIILMAIVFILMLFPTNLRMYFDEIALAKNSSNTTNNALTGKDASQSAESLVRSIMDPSSLMSSVINETGGSTNQSSSGVAKNSSTSDNNNNNTTATT